VLTGAIQRRFSASDHRLKGCLVVTRPATGWSRQRRQRSQRRERTCSSGGNLR